MAEWLFYGHKSSRLNKSEAHLEIIGVFYFQDSQRVYRNYLLGVQTLKRFNSLIIAGVILHSILPNLFAQSDVSIRSYYDSTFALSWEDSLSYMNYSGSNIYKLLNQDLFIKNIERKRWDLDLRLMKSNFDSDDKNTIYKCCDSSVSGKRTQYYSNYDEVKSLKFKVVNIKPTQYWANWSTTPYDAEAEPQSETYILTLKPNNNDPEVYHWFHPYFEGIGEFELVGFLERAKRLVKGKKFVLGWIPYEYADSNLNILDKWECLDVTLEIDHGIMSKYVVTLKNKNGSKAKVDLSDFYPIQKSYVYSEDKADYFLNKYKKKLWEATLKRELTIGMTSELLLEIWRKPDNISKRQTKGKTTERWDYSDGSYLVLENGKLSEIYNAKE